ncbi:MAG: CsbD family protein [Actinomycetota bacterium]|nr:CsbD family protein [Actinomycetota bacterium]
MSLIDKAKNKLDEAKGMVKEGTGKVIGNEQMEYEGKIEQGKANAKQSGEHIKDAAASVKDAFKS